MKNPDWANAADYNFAENLDGKGWAWEFLRRNQSYCNDYLKIRDIYKKAEEELGLFSEKNTEAWENYDPVIVKDPLTKNGDSPGKWNGRVWDKNVAPDWIHLEQHQAGTWGLKSKMEDPACDIAPEFRFPYDHPKYLTETDSKTYLIEPPYPDSKKQSHSNFLGIGFDLTLPIDKQLKKASDILYSQVKLRKIRLRRDKETSSNWITYLRLIDAWEDKPKVATNKEWTIDIVKGIWNLDLTGNLSMETQNSIKKWSKAANRLKDHDYKKCLTITIAPRIDNPKYLPQ